MKKYIVRWHGNLATLNENKNTRERNCRSPQPERSLPVIQAMQAIALITA